MSKMTSVVTNTIILMPPCAPRVYNLLVLCFAWWSPKVVKLVQVHNICECKEQIELFHEVSSESREQYIPLNAINF